MPRPALDLSNLSKSMNEVLVLSVLSHGPKHGYQLALEVEEGSRGLIRFKHGTLYPILHKLEKQKLIVGAWSNQGPRGRRKAYELTEAGRVYAAGLRTDWRELFSCLQGFFTEDA